MSWLVLPDSRLPFYPGRASDFRFCHLPLASAASPRLARSRPLPHPSVPARTFPTWWPCSNLTLWLPGGPRVRHLPGQMEARTLLSPLQGWTGPAGCLPPPPPARPQWSLAWPLHPPFFSPLLGDSGCYKHSLLTLPGRQGLPCRARPGAGTGRKSGVEQGGGFWGMGSREGGPRGAVMVSEHCRMGMNAHGDRA